MSDTESRLLEREKYLDERERKLKEKEKDYNKAIAYKTLHEEQERGNQNSQSGQVPPEWALKMNSLENSVKELTHGLIRAKQQAEQVAYHSKLQTNVRSLILQYPDKFPHLERLGLDEAQNFIDMAKKDHKAQFGKEPDLLKAAESAETRASNFISKATGLSKEILDEVRKKYEDGEYEVDDKKVDDKKKTEEGDKKEKSKGEDQTNPTPDSEKETQEEEQSADEDWVEKELSRSDATVIDSIPRNEVNLDKEYGAQPEDSEASTNEE